MIIATVITCPQRWNAYRALRKNFESLQLPCALRTFQSSQELGSPFINNILNARAALQYAANRLPEGAGSWLLYLEDDVKLATEFPLQLPALIEIGDVEGVDCWYLCNRKNRVRRQWQMDRLTVNALDSAPRGAHALLLPQRHLRGILDAHWGDLSDHCIFKAIAGPAGKVWQVIQPVLAEHTGEISTFCPDTRQALEIDLCN